jgi:hypothetical protein
MKTSRRRSRKVDRLATVNGVRAVLNELQEQFPKLYLQTDQQLFSLLNAVRHSGRSSSQNYQKGRPANWDRETLQKVSQSLTSILAQHSQNRVSLNSFVCLYLRILHFPAEIQTELALGNLNLQEATQLARLTSTKLVTDENTAQAIRLQLIKEHQLVAGSQSQLRSKVQAILGESGLISGETLALGARQADVLLNVNPDDTRHLFFETIKDLFYALRSLDSSKLEERDIGALMSAADLLSNTILQIEQRQNSYNKQPTSANQLENGNRPITAPIADKDDQGHVIYRFE